MAYQYSTGIATSVRLALIVPVLYSHFKGTVREDLNAPFGQVVNLDSQLLYVVVVGANSPQDPPNPDYAGHLYRFTRLSNSTCYKRDSMMYCMAKFDCPPKKRAGLKRCMSLRADFRGKRTSAMHVQ